MAANAAAAQPALRYAEPVQLSLKAGNAEFDAYGQRFSLVLTGNERVFHKLSETQRTSLASYRLLRGSVTGIPGSWVRLTETPDGVEGAIWDGREFYAVTRHEKVAAFLTTPIAAAPEQTVVYRLSDLRDALPADFCGDTAKTGATALDQYKSLVAEMQTGGIIGPSITRQIDISLIADSAFQQTEAGDPTAAMLARLNIVEGIFSEQVGLLILASDIRLMSADADPFTSTKPSTLLEQLSKYRSSTTSVRARGLAHLMTGKDLDGTTAGIAYVRTVCERERAVSLSQRSYGTTISALVMAHELGHNFGATHDGEAGTPCASTAAGFIMASSVTGYGTFSQCSIDSMKPVIAAASCVTPAEFADITLESDSHVITGEAGVPFTLPFTVWSAGNVSATDAAFTLTLPPSMSYVLDSAGSTQGSCTVSGFSASCLLGEMAPGSSAQVSVTGHSRTATSTTAQGRVSAANDRITSNNSRLVEVSLRSGIDAQLTLATSAAELAVGAPFEVYADVSSLRAMSVSNSTLSLNLNQPVTTAAVSGGNCTVNATSVVCAIGEIPSGSTRRVTVQALAQSAGPLSASASISAPDDGDPTNNSGSASGWVQAERDLELGSSSEPVELSVGAMHEFVYTIRSRGTLPTGSAELLLTLPGALAVDAIDAGGAPCTHPSEYVWRCTLGTLSPGDSRVVRLRFHATAPTSADISAVAITTDDGYDGNNSINLPLRIDHLVDLGLTLAAGVSGVEDTPLEGQVVVVSNGRLAVDGGTLDIALHAAGRLEYAAIHHGNACTLLDERRARCHLPALPRGASLSVDYIAAFAEPGSYDIAFAAAAAGDSEPANDTLVRPLLVLPYYDASVSGSLMMSGLFGEQTRVQTFTVSTGPRALASARLLAGHAPPALRVQAISASVGDCHVDTDAGGICDFTDLPADANVSVSVTYHAAEGTAVVEPVISVSTPGDVFAANDSVTARVETMGITDVELRVTGTVAGPRSSSLSFPVIEIINGGNKAMTPRLEVTLPAGVGVDDVAASAGICTGTSTLRCDFQTLEPFARASVSLVVRASANGSFISNVKVTTANDVNPANDAGEVVLEINGATVAASKEPGGGGGRIEWLALALLAMLVARKRIVASTRVARSADAASR